MSDGSDKLWSVRGVPDEVRKLAQEAADRAGMKIGPWVNHAIRQTSASDRGGLVGEVVSDTPSDRASLSDVIALAAAVAQLAHAPGCGGSAARMRALLDQQMDAAAMNPLPKRRAAPRRITSEA